MPGSLNVIPNARTMFAFCVFVVSDTDCTARFPHISHTTIVTFYYISYVSLICLWGVPAMIWECCRVFDRMQLHEKCNTISHPNLVHRAGLLVFLSCRRSLFSVESCRFLVGGKFEAHFWWPFAMTLFTRVMILSALLSTVLTTNRLCSRWWLEFQFKY